MTDDISRNMIGERAELGVDGNAAFVLLGEDIQSGECEFVEFAIGSDEREQARCAKEALRRLRARLNRPDLSYFLGESHPLHA